MKTYRNYAIGDTRKRIGKNRFTSESFYDLAARLKGQTQAFAMFLSYGVEFAEHAEQEILKEDGTVKKAAWSCRDWSGEAPAHFVDFPVDFDASENPRKALRDCHNFVADELIGRGIDSRYFVIYLSGGKGFHVHISASCLDLELPAPNAGYRLKALAKLWKEKYDTIDLSIYNSTALFRLPGTRHKSGLHKVEVSLDDLTLEHYEKRLEWAASPPDKVRIPELGEPPVRIEVPDHVPTRAEFSYSAEIDFDPTALITPNCPWLQKVLEDPSAGGKDGEGRDRRRNAVGILLSAHDVSTANPELQWFMARLEEHPYMTPERMEDAFKWVREFDRDGEIKCKKTCYSVGCSAPQRKKCGTRSPLDWKLKKRKLDLVSVPTARANNREALKEIIAEEGNGVYVLRWPVGLGKTFSFIREVSEQGLTAFYTAQTHVLAIQTHLQFLEAGLVSRHIASRDYLAENADFECPFVEEVQLAISNGYGSHTVCGKCPRRRKPREVEGEEDKVELPDEGYEPCDYFEQFEDLGMVDVAVGVHNHLYEYMYEKAEVRDRSLTVIDESPFEALGKEVAPIEEDRLREVRAALDEIVAGLEKPAEKVKAGVGKGLFGRASALLEQQMAEARSREVERRLRVLKAFQDIFYGRLFDLELLAGMDPDALKASWFETANEISTISGLAERYALPDDLRFLAIPYPIPAAMALATLDKIYDPTVTSYLPVELPPNKTLVLDATSSNDVYGPVVARLTVGREPRPYRFVDHPLVEQPYSHVTQITSSSYGVAKLHDEGQINYLGQLVTWLTERHPGKSLIVCHKQHVGFWHKLFANNPQIEVATYGALKGLNRWSDCVAQYIIGTPFVPDHGIRELCARLGDDIPLSKLVESATLRRTMLLARNGDTCVISRRVYGGYRFHTAVAQMKSQWEVTQAVRLRLYDKSIEDKQQLYVFSNVELQGMYADAYKTVSELAFELQQERKGRGRQDLEVKGVAYEQITAWFDALPKGAKFKSANVPPVASDRYIRYWLMAAINADWIAKAGYTYEKLV